MVFQIFIQINIQLALRAKFFTPEEEIKSSVCERYGRTHHSYPRLLCHKLEKHSLVLLCNILSEKSFHSQWDNQTCLFQKNGPSFLQYHDMANLIAILGRALNLFRGLRGNQSWDTQFWMWKYEGISCKHIAGLASPLPFKFSWLWFVCYEMIKKRHCKISLLPYLSLCTTSECF